MHHFFSCNITYPLAINSHASIKAIIAYLEFPKKRLFLSTIHWNTIDPGGANKANPIFLKMPDIYFCCSVTTKVIYQEHLKKAVTVGYIDQH